MIHTIARAAEPVVSMGTGEHQKEFPMPRDFEDDDFGFDPEPEEDDIFDDEDDDFFDDDGDFEDEDEDDDDFSDFDDDEEEDDEDF